MVVMMMMLMMMMMTILMINGDDDDECDAVGDDNGISSGNGNVEPRELKNNSPVSSQCQHELAQVDDDKC
jgi:hypothetical protein